MTLGVNLVFEYRFSFLLHCFHFKAVKCQFYFHFSADPSLLTSCRDGWMSACAISVVLYVPFCLMRLGFTFQGAVVPSVPKRSHLTRFYIWSPQHFEKWWCFLQVLHFTDVIYLCVYCTKVYCTKASGISCECLNKNRLSICGLVCSWSWIYLVILDPGK